LAESYILNERFQGGTLNAALKWKAEPQSWSLDPERSRLTLRTDENTDYWQRTHYGFQADNGHYLYAETDRNFRLTTKVEAFPKSKYDQAGLMIRFSEDAWVKTSLEYIPGGLSKLGAVVTNRGYSDWSTQQVPLDSESVHVYVRISRIARNVYVDFSWDGEVWNQIRIAHLDIPDPASVMAGLYACSPQGKDQVVHFDFLTLEELSDDPQEAYL
jgi:uncharacterized protein